MSNPSASPSPITRDIERVSPELVQAAARYRAAILADVAGRRGTVHGRVRPLSPKMKVAGPAVTVEVRAGDNPRSMRRSPSRNRATSSWSTARATSRARCSAKSWRRRRRRAASPASSSTALCATRTNWPTATIRSSRPASIRAARPKASRARECADLAGRHGSESGRSGGRRRRRRRRHCARRRRAYRRSGAEKLDFETARIAAIHKGDLRPGWIEKELRAAGMLAEGEAL